MATVTLKGNPVQLYGELPAKEQQAPYFRLVKADLSEVTLDYFKGKNLILNIFPSIDTPVCAMSVRKFMKLPINYPLPKSWQYLTISLLPCRDTVRLKGCIISSPSLPSGIPNSERSTVY